ncbi:hypothetical protein SPRG_00996 [Saprolegnia parasitica CBS 223.65]|uniref:Uncharacterized protein n=1 Tax=Saprolegnia parasitica (strain CBS 223.65) TaxID=695850 RepID=A0A067CW40_SAPPC|nr:hypothetical protein SPRG_00996 [Saprolegnia parasitica CBS 223.65]KDO34934.1 hypothetical protein SPRG_00996 [Saprolegnia parasitica CBS 223.65]|eukprot:XP_012194590.1 hypothetical protein SPRG_00996 [Saprolegnia parasitica CBS 223.65]
MLQRCELLSGPQTYLVQAVLFAIALASLWYKRHVERPKRSLEIWALDVGKQGIGAVVGHFTNILIAISLPPVTDQCIWYFLNFVTDCSLGMLIALSLLKFQQELAVSLNWHAIHDSGDYGNPPSYRIWGIQLAAWLSIIVFSKGIVTSVLIASAGPLGAIGNALFSPLAMHPMSELIVVMIICPSFLNVMQFWIQDSFLKRDTSPYGRTTSSKMKAAGMDPSLQISLL